MLKILQGTLGTKMVLILNAKYVKKIMIKNVIRGNAPRFYFKRKSIIKKESGKCSMQNGTVKWFNSEKGYGFISGEDGQDIFVHYSSIVGEGYRNLEEGQSVVYKIGENEKGKVATNVVIK